MSTAARPQAAATPSTDGVAVAALAQLEAAVHGLTEALRTGDAGTLDAAVARLQAELPRVLHRLPPARARTRGRAPGADLQQRLRALGAELAAQREAVARAGAALGRAAAVLLPAAGEAYGATGSGLRTPTTGSLIA